MDASEIPDDLWSEILCRLPAKILVRFRYLSKFHMTLIGSSHFAKRQCICNRSEMSVIITKGRDAYRIDIDSNTSCANVQALINPEGDDSVSVVGCCRGIVCLRYVDKIMFWNPLTRQFKCFDDVAETVGHYYFGHDEITDDFKLLRIRDYGSEIYRSRIDSWKKIEGINGSEIRLDFCSDVFVESTNATHFSASEEPPFKMYKTILAFDFVTEAFNPVPLPEFDDFDAWTMSGLSSLDGYLCFLRNNIEEEYSDVWVMKESWAKVFSFSLSISQFVSNRNLLPLHFAYSELLLLSTGYLDEHDQKHRLYVYEVDKKKLKKLLCSVHRHSFYHAYTGMPSNHKSFLFTPTLLRP